MARIIFLVTVLAAVCYISQANPVPEDTQIIQLQSYTKLYDINKLKDDSKKILYDINKLKDDSKKIFQIFEFYEKMADDTWKKIKENYDTITSEILKRLVEGAKDNFKQKGEELQEEIKKIGPKIDQVKEAIKHFSKNNEENFKKLIKETTEVKQKIAEKAKEIQHQVEKLIEDIKTQAEEFRENIGEKAKEIKNKIKNRIEDLNEKCNELKEEVRKKQKELRKKIKEFGAIIKQNFEEVKGRWIESLTDISNKLYIPRVKNWIIDCIIDMKKFIEMGEKFGKQNENLLKDNLKKGGEFMKDILKDMADKAEGIFNEIMEKSDKIQDIDQIKDATPWTNVQKKKD